MGWSLRLLRTGQVAIVLLLVVVLGACSGPSGKASGSGADNGAKAGAAGSPPLLERTPSQFQADLASLKGRVVIINFWASWCGPCKSEMPALEQVSQAYAGKPVTLIGVDSSDVRDHADQLLTNLKVTYPTVYDSKGIQGGIATAWSVASLPQTWFIAKDGTRSGRIPRPLSAAELRTRIDQLL
jgi:thiol-disulfide isomerase/thioredoxin